LIAASTSNMSEIVKLLLKKKINLDLQDVVSFTHPVNSLAILLNFYDMIGF